jgi:hypothetical protein
MLRYTVHAQIQMALRNLPDAWIERTVNAPEWTRPDPIWHSRTRSYCGTTEAGGRILRVVHEPRGPDILVITAHFDRSARRP